MSEREWEAMNEDEFDDMLKQDLPELPPEDITHAVTPWRKAMNRVVAGLALTTLTLNFLWLDSILPAIGMVLLLLGIRALRRENGWLRVCWVLTALRTAYSWAVLILQATIWHNTVLADALTAAAVISVGVNLVLFFCLWRGLLAVQRKAGQTARARGAGGLVIWYALLIPLGLVRYSGWLVFILVVALYICILRSLYKLSKGLDEAGYAVEAAPVRLPDRAVAIALAVVLAVGLACAYLFGNSYPMAWTAVEPDSRTEVAQVRAELEALGFPAEVLDDLTGEDILACRGALRVVVEVNDHPVNAGRIVREQTGGDHIHEYRVYDVKELRITGVAVELPGERTPWRIFHHFLWMTDPGFYGTECIQLWPAYHISEGWAPDGEPTGQVLYDSGGQTRAAPFAYLGRQIYSYDSVFWGTQTSNDIFAAFSMPRGGERYRGYVSYGVKARAEGYIIDSWCNYTHQKSWLQYPVSTAMEQRMVGRFTEGVFYTVQNTMQYFPDQDE